MSEYKESLFAVLPSHLDTGLRGIPVGTCGTSFVDPVDGVHYAGYPIADLADFDPEDIVYLLFNKSLPTADESAEMKRNLASRSSIPEGALDLFKMIGQGQGHPMDWLTSVLWRLAVLKLTKISLRMG